MVKYNKPEDAWHNLNNVKRWCEIHRLEFGANIKCPKCYPDTLSFPMENNNSKKSGVKKSERTLRGLSERHKLAYDYSVKGKSLSWIAKKLKCSKTSVHNYIKKYKAFIKVDKGVGIVNDKPICKKVNDFSKRLHNDSFSFLIDPVDLSMVKDKVRLKYSSYVLDKRNPDWHVQIFSGKLVVRFLRDIVAGTIKECKVLADKRVKDFLSSYSYQGIKFEGEAVQVSRHMAILGTDVARKVIKDKKKLIVRFGDGRLRAGVDFSNNVPEWETFDKDESIRDGVTSEKYFEAVLDKEGEYDTPDITKYKVDRCLFAVEKFAKESVRYAEEISEHRGAIKDMRFGVKELTSSVVELRDIMKAIRDSLKK